MAGDTGGARTTASAATAIGSPSGLSCWRWSAARQTTARREARRDPRVEEIIGQRGSVSICGGGTIAE